jgi:tetratricopeptide (TPR) repeat protein
VVTSVASAQIPLELRFDGRPVDPTAPPDFSCFSLTQNQWTACRVQKVGEPGAWLLERPPPGRYRMHVSIDENATNPRRYPGDYEAQLAFEITDVAPERIVVDLPRLIHLTRPGDNGRSLEGMLRGCATQPRFDTPRYAWTLEARVDFAWEAIVAGADYRYTVAAWPCAAGGARREVLTAGTSATAVTIALPPIGRDEQYVFRVEAWKDGRMVGDLYTHDSGAHSWNYRFQVVNASLPRWAYGVAAIGLLIPILVVARLLVGLEAARRRRRMAWLAGGALLAIAIAAIAVNAVQYTRQREQRRLAAERAAVEAARQSRQREFIATFASAAPRPAWWDEVATPYRVDNVGDLLSAWQGHPHTELGERQFFKAAYQGIVDHPDDEHVVATAIDLIHWVERDYPHRLALARFGYERYFHHNRRIDNCASCMVGDTTQAIALNLSRLLREAGRPEEAIAVGRRVIDERGSEISPYKLAETWSELAWAHWRTGDRDEALRIAREGLERYGETVRGGELRSALEAFEREGPAADH